MPTARKTTRVLLVSAVTVFVLALVVWFGGRAVLSRSVSPHSGEVRGAGLSKPVEVSFDARAVPRIWAETDSDLRFALGYVHASERLFQMELIRRMARGDLSEVFGKLAFDVDLRQRRIGFGRKAERDVATLSQKGRETLERYVAGINAWIESAPILPPEFVILRFRPRPWTPADCLAIALYQTWFSHELMDADESFQRLRELGGEKVLPSLRVSFPWSPATVPDGPLSELLGGDPYPWRVTAASNSWAVAPSRTKSGKAIHASDPHLAINQAPGLWYLAAIHSSEGIDAAGVTQPGLPFVLMGHNAEISFAFTVSSVDILDSFDEELSGPDGSLVETADGPRPLEKFVEEIRVKGEELRRVTVEATPHGPLLKKEGSRGISFHWAGFDFPLGDLVDAALRLERARDFEEFRRSVTSFGALDANWVYSDRAGNIGYQLGVPIPLRDYEDTYARHPGKAPSSRWKGYRPLPETPHVLNPAAGFVASCNNQPVAASWPYPLPGFYDPYRITRATTLLAKGTDWTREKSEEMQLDLVSGRALRWKDLCAQGAEKIGQADVARELRAWDGAVATPSRPAALFQLCWIELTRALFEDDFGSDWKKARTIQEQVLSGSAPGLIDDRRTPEIETAAEVAASAMTRAISTGGNRTYGELSTLTVSHPLSSVRLLDRWLRLSRGPVPVGGDAGSLNANFNGWDEKTREFRSQIGPSMRFVLDWSDPDSFTINGALGQSGNPLSPHYDDFFLPSLRGERWTLPFSREKQRASEVARLRLVPG
ncbi:MAG: penicillin acylase family protein [Thermoanaerobaculia bacterium]|nr:penicillin acylase family protein [Thermoanaerobaculia bacterium]